MYRIIRRKHYYGLLYFLISITFGWKIINFVDKNPQFYYYWDWPGHIDKALKLGWPWEGGWDITFWGGYSTLTYPPLSHYLLKIFLINHNTYSSLLIFILFIFALQIFAYIHLINQTVKYRPHRLICFVLFTVLLTALPGKYLGSMRGVVVTGGFSANIATSMLFLLLASHKQNMKAIWQGLLFLTHPFTSSIGLIYLTLSFFIGIIDYFQRRINSKILKSSFLPLLISLGIGAPWLVPAIDPNFKGIASTIGTYDYMLPFTLIAICGMVITSTKNVRPLHLTLLTISLFTALPMTWGYELTKVGIQGLHMYRYLLYLGFLMPIPIVSIFVSKRIISRPVSQIILSSALFLILVFEKLPIAEERLSLDSDKLSPLKGRIINSTSISSMIDQPHYLNHEIPNQSRLLGSVGLFFESSQYGMQYYEILNQINPLSFKNGTYTNLFRNDSGQAHLKFDITSLADLLGINYITFTAMDTSISTVGAIPIGSIISNKSPVTPIYIKEISTEQLIEALTQLPIYDPMQNLGLWWIQSNHKQLYTKTKIEVPDNINLTKPPVEIISTTPTTIQIRIISDQPTPIRLKFTHNKYWKTIATNNTSYSSQPYWISPGHILLIGYGDILLSWHQPPYMTALLIFSLMLLVYSVFQITSKNKP